jgi:hypothetical protein
MVVLLSTHLLVAVLLRTHFLSYMLLGERFLIYLRMCTKAICVLVRTLAEVRKNLRIHAKNAVGLYFFVFSGILLNCYIILCVYVREYSRNYSRIQGGTFAQCVPENKTNK